MGYALHVLVTPTTGTNYDILVFAHGLREL